MNCQQINGEMRKEDMEDGMQSASCHLNGIHTQENIKLARRFWMSDLHIQTHLGLVPPEHRKGDVAEELKTPAAGKCQLVWELIPCTPPDLFSIT